MKGGHGNVGTLSADGYISISYRSGRQTTYTHLGVTWRRDRESNADLPVSKLTL